MWRYRRATRYPKGQKADLVLRSPQVSRIPALPAVSGLVVTTLGDHGDCHDLIVTSADGSDNPLNSTLPCLLHTQPLWLVEGKKKTFPKSFFSHFPKKEKGDCHSVIKNSPVLVSRILHCFPASAAETSQPLPQKLPNLIICPLIGSNWAFWRSVKPNKASALG